MFLKQISMCQQLMHYFYLLLLLHYRWWIIKPKYTQHIYIYIYVLKRKWFLPKKFKLCCNLFLFSNYLASCFCFEIRFFENWVPYITRFYHFWIMWKFCDTGLKRRGFTRFKKIKLELNFLKIEFHRDFFFFFGYHYSLLVLVSSSQFWKKKNV